MSETHYISGYNGHRLSDYGAVSPEVAGVHDLPARETSITYIPGIMRPAVRVGTRRARETTFGLVVAGDSHTDLLSKLDSIKAILEPDDDFHALTVADKTNLQVQALSLGFQVDTRELPNLFRVVTFRLPFLCFPYWEDAALQTATIETATGSITNGGRLTAYPTWTCTLLADMPSGLSFTVGAQTFTYEGALDLGDSLVIDADEQAQTVTLNGLNAIGSAALTTAFPSLAVGANAIGLSDYTKFKLGCSYRRRY
jgi:phage-related protein